MCRIFPGGAESSRRHPFEVLLLLFALWSATASADLPAPVAEAARAADIPPSAIALYVAESGVSAPLAAHNADAPMQPASVIKLVTTYAALAALGPAWRWQTEVYATAPIEDGRLDGDLFLKGYGDPSITLETLWLWLRELKARGLSDLRGDLVVDRSHFDLPVQDPAAFDGEGDKPYNAPPDALLVNFRARELRFFPSADGKKVRVVLDVEGNTRVESRVRPVAGPCEDWREGVSVRLKNVRRGRLLAVSGPYPVACGEGVLRLVLLDPDSQLEDLFRGLWTELGGRFRGRVVSGVVPRQARLIARFESRPLAEIVRDINKFSNNVMARQLFLTLGAELLGAPATPDKGAEAVLAVLAREGLDFAELVLDNGSGLSRRERISARHLARLLEIAQRSPWFAEFEASLPIVGLDGTMKKRLREESLGGRVRLKSGSLDGVRAIAGYVVQEDGRRRILVCLVNDPGAERARPVLDAAIRWAVAARAPSRP